MRKEKDEKLVLRNVVQEHQKRKYFTEICSWWALWEYTCTALYRIPSYKNVYCNVLNWPNIRKEGYRNDLICLIIGKQDLRTLTVIRSENLVSWKKENFQCVIGGNTVSLIHQSLIYRLICFVKFKYVSCNNASRFQVFQNMGLSTNATTLFCHLLPSRTVSIALGSVFLQNSHAVYALC